MSLFITFEGGEGCGKSYQSKQLYKWLRGSGYDAVLTFEPGGTILGNELRHVLKKKRQEIVEPIVELMLFNASRAQLVAEVIRPSLQEGKIVLCDRFADSTTVYQGYARGLDMQIVRRINEVATQGVSPDLTILLDMPAGSGLKRKNNGPDDRFEEEKLSFHQKVRDGFLELADMEKKRWMVIDGMLSRSEISVRIRRKVEALISQKDSAAR